MASAKRQARIAAAVVGGALLLLLVVRHAHYYLSWRNFDVVEPGVLYRSGQLRPNQLRAAIESYGLHAVLNLGHADAEDEREEGIVRGLGLRYWKTNWPGSDRVISEDELDWAYAIMSDPENQPLLVHCDGGMHRAGVTVAYWRILRSGWSRQRIREEMVAHRFNPATRPELMELVDRLFQKHRGEGVTLGTAGLR
ncbi:MAG TPA: hypothetical protein VKF62_13955 [Planctomycetota bacterium]|nr:hypothetical protein [Planctomycetota bacterium]